MERKKKKEEDEKVPDKGKEEDGESIKSEESLSPVDDVGAKDAGEEASDPTDSFHPKEGYSTSVQETGLQDLTSKESDGEARGFVESSKEVDVEAEKGSTGQVTGHQFKKESSGKEDEVDSAKKQMPRACKWLSWWKKRWPVLGKVQAREGEENEKFPSKGEDDDPNGADKNPDKTFGEEPVNMAKTKQELGGQHMFHTTKYGSEELLGMRTKGDGG